MKVISINANGIRAAARKGLFEWLEAQQADFVCVQETKAQEHQLDKNLHYLNNYHCEYFDAEKKGYSGVALYAKHEPLKVITGLGWETADTEGRYIQFDYDNYSVVSLYLPSGSSGEERQQVKFEFLDDFEKHLKKLAKQKREFIICGDWNIAHTKMDIKNWRGNQKNSGFLPEERAWMDSLFGPWKFVDAFREVCKEPDQYTWWSNRGQAWANNVGWRIDYQVITAGLKDKVRSASIYKEQRFSDHAPLIMEYDDV